MTLPKNPIDRRPFRSKAECQRSDALQNQYRNVAIPDVVATLRRPKPAQTTPSRAGTNANRR
ncbi:hypothetical protein [Bauldia sp.]|uniref:hypothetical protein n=1 Tax=Bauldia sp. TaxID=2575872 RepID=UPI003BABAA3B